MQKKNKSARGLFVNEVQWIFKRYFEINRTTIKFRIWKLDCLEHLSVLHLFKNKNNKSCLQAQIRTNHHRNMTSTAFTKRKQSVGQHIIDKRIRKHYPLYQRISMINEPSLIPYTSYLWSTHTLSNVYTQVVTNGQRTNKHCTHTH